MIKIVVDAMGGDNAPGEIVKGAVEAANERKDIRIFLTGKEDVVKRNWAHIPMIRHRSQLWMPLR